MNHKNYKIRVVSNSKRNTVIFLGILLYFATVFIALITVLSETLVK